MISRDPESNGGIPGGAELHFFTTSRIHKDAQGNHTTATAPLAVEGLSPYFHHFDRVYIHGRVGKEAGGEMPFSLNHPRLVVDSIPLYTGGVDFYRKYFEIRKYVHRTVVSPQIHVALWLPSPLATVVTKRAKSLGAPLLAIIVGDSSEVAKAILPKPVKCLGAWLLRHKVRKANRRADASIYVTLKSLQENYPPSPSALTLTRTNLSLPEGILEQPLADFNIEKIKTLSILAVGSQQQNYKGHDLLIRAVAQLQREGLDCELTLVGAGVFHDELRELGNELDVKRLEMLKSVGDSEAVARLVRSKHIFVMPSRTEGMPKALLEAMAVGTLSLGSDVGGIPEVLDAESVFRRESVDAIVEAVRNAIRSDEYFQAIRQIQRSRARVIHSQFSGSTILNQFLSEWLS